jgi:non-specific serine/threonine protein kinase
MTEIGTVIDGKYEILKEIGRGGMSIVYLAMDKRLNKQWAVKEIRKKGSGKNDEVVVNSLLAEANMMKKLDHPSLPRIVDIIDNGITIYVVMDYIEGESLDKILSEYGAQPEELVVNWAKQLCDALSYLHSQKPSIIYRDMKPANVMLKPEGNIKIIDFGIAREYKEQNLADTTVLGTKGYAPPEQYSGQTDPRSDIFALGMTMHHLLTGVDPRNGEPYAPVRQWNPELSEGIEIIIDRCVEPAAENRYQSCADLLYDLEHPELITKGFKKKQRRKLISFIVAIGMSAVMAIAGLVLNTTATSLNTQDYEANIGTSNPENYYTAIDIYPQRIEAYNLLIDYYKNHDATEDNVKKIGNTIEENSSSLDTTQPEFAELYYNIGKLYFAQFGDSSLKSAAVNAKPFFEMAVSAEASYDKKEIANCYLSICNFMTKQSKTSENSLDDYTKLFEEIETAIGIIDKSSDSEANYDKISLYYVTMLLINDQADLMASVGFERETALEWIDDLYIKANSITSTLDYVNKTNNKVTSSYDSFISNINTKYNEVEKRQQGGN